MRPVGNNTIYDRILNKGREDSEQLLEDAKRRAKLIVDVAVEETNKALMIEREKMNARLDEAYKTKMTEFEQSMKQTSLAFKKALIHDVFLQAQNKLANRTDQELTHFVVSLLKKDALTGGERLRVNKKDHERYLRLFSSRKDGTLDKLSTALGKNITLTLDQVGAPIHSGFIVVGEEFDINHSTEAILGSLFEQAESAVAASLFAEERS